MTENMHSKRDVPLDEKAVRTFEATGAGIVGKWLKYFIDDPDLIRFALENYTDKFSAGTRARLEESLKDDD